MKNSEIVQKFVCGQSLFFCLRVISSQDKSYIFSKCACSIRLVWPFEYPQVNKMSGGMLKLRERVEDVKKRIAKRRRERQSIDRVSTSRNNRFNPLARDEERFGETPFVEYEYTSKSNEPLFRKELVTLQILVAVSLFLIVGILFKDTSPRWESARTFVTKAMENEFQFAAVLDWYEGQFGDPLALLPTPEQANDGEQKQTEFVVSQDGSSHQQIYAVPAAGRVLEPFTKDSQGIMVETGRDSVIEAINDGYVIFTGVKDDIGKTVVIQHPDGSETWYGNLDSIDVKLYDFVESRAVLGKVTNTSDGQAGTFYFAFKQGDDFIDPNQVISFD